MKFITDCRVEREKKLLDGRELKIVQVARTLNEVVERIFWYFITSDDHHFMIEVYAMRQKLDTLLTA